MQGGVLELARQAAAAAAAKAERGAARAAVRRYRGVMGRGNSYVAEIMDEDGLRPLYLGSYATPEEAAFVYDTAARILHGDKANPNFPEPPAPVPAVGGGVAAPGPRARRGRPLLGHARMRVSPYGQQSAPPEAPAAGGAQHQAFSDQQAPAPHFGALPDLNHGGAAPAFSEFLYPPAAGPALGAAGGSDNVAGFYAAGPALTAAGGSDGAGFSDMVDMIGPEPEVPRPFSTYAANSALSTAEPKLLLFLVIDDSDDESVVDDNFPDGVVIGESTWSASSRPAVPRLRL